MPNGHHIRNIDVDEAGWAPRLPGNKQDPIPQTMHGDIIGAQAHRKSPQRLDPLCLGMLDGKLAPPHALPQPQSETIREFCLFDWRRNNGNQPYVTPLKRQYRVSRKDDVEISCLDNSV